MLIHTVFIVRTSRVLPHLKRCRNQQYSKHEIYAEDTHNSQSQKHNQTDFLTVTRNSQIMKTDQRHDGT